MENPVYWLIILAMFILIEIMTLGLITIWFAGGSFAAFLVSLIVDNLILEVIVFLSISVALLFFIRPLVIRYLKPRRLKTNYEGVIGKQAVVIIAIDNSKAEGQVTVEGQEWSAKSLNGNVIEKGNLVKIQGIAGVKLMVTKSTKPHEVVEP